jgi:signal peptidase I
MKLFTLSKSRKALFSIYHLFLRKRKKLPPEQSSEIVEDLKALEKTVMSRDRAGASSLAHQCLRYTRTHLKKSGFEQFRDLVFALAFALLVALTIRQVWFELYEIPTGSMRPTFKEGDRLVVSKTTFGINRPFSAQHFYFDPKLPERSGIMVFTVENMDVHDAETLYFYFFPGKKQLVKRLLGKPGDTLYFYGGKIYGVDAAGKDITPLLQPKELEQIDHIPFIRFDGNVVTTEPFQSGVGEGYRNAIIYQMNEPVARLSLLSNHNVEGELLSLKQIRDRSMPPIKNYFDLWGFKNFATARLLTKEQIKKRLNKLDQDVGEGTLYLDLKHHPSLDDLALGKDQLGRLRPKFVLSRAVIPLDEPHLRRIFDNLYTVRFVVKNNFAMRYGMSPGSSTHFLPRLEGVPDGTYEFYHGEAYQIKWGSVAKKLSKDHSLYKFTPERVQLFFNLGIDFDTRLYSDALGELFDTSRFAYFRDGDLYLMGTPVIKKGEAALSSFITRQKTRAEEANLQNPYHPFVDEGAPYKDGKLDVEKIRQFGLRIPENMYLGLGDNFAVSSDSRDFGFVPQGNLRGAPSFIFWPTGPRFGVPNQPPYPWINFPRIIVWGLVLVAIIFWRLWHRRRYRLPLKFE